MPRPLPAQLMDTSIPGLGTSPALAHLEQLGPRIRMSRAMAASSSALVGPGMPVSALPAALAPGAGLPLSAAQLGTVDPARSTFSSELFRRLDAMPEKTAQHLHRLLADGKGRLGAGAGGLPASMRGATPLAPPGSPSPDTSGTPTAGQTGSAGLLDSIFPSLRGIVQQHMAKNKEYGDWIFNLWEKYNPSRPPVDLSLPSPRKPQPIPQPIHLPGELPACPPGEKPNTGRKAAGGTVLAIPPAPPRYKVKPEDVAPPPVKRPPTVLATAPLPQAYALQDEQQGSTNAAPATAKPTVLRATQAQQGGPPRRALPTALARSAPPVTQIAEQQVATTAPTIRRPVTALASSHPLPVAQVVHHPSVGPAFLRAAIPVSDTPQIPTRRPAVLKMVASPSMAQPRQPVGMLAGAALPVAQVVHHPSVGPAFLRAAIPVSDTPQIPTRRPAVLKMVASPSMAQPRQPVGMLAGAALPVAQVVHHPTVDPATLPMAVPVQRQATSTPARLFNTASSVPRGSSRLGGIPSGPTLTGRGVLSASGMPTGDNRLEKEMSKLTRVIEALKDTMERQRGSDGKTQAQPSATTGSRDTTPMARGGQAALGAGRGAAAMAAKVGPKTNSADIAAVGRQLGNMLGKVL